MFKNLMLKTKITMVFIVINILIFALIIGILSSIVYINIYKGYENLISEKTKNFVENVQMIISIQAKDYLEKISEKEFKSILAMYEEYEKGKLKKNEYIEKVRNLLKGKSIGKNGFYFVLDRSNFPEKVIALVHPSFEGEDLLGDWTIRRISEKMSGFVEYTWKNKGETEEKRMVAFLRYFDKMDWIIAASAYVEDYSTFLNLKEIRNLMERQLENIQGNSFVIDYEGNVILHTTFMGKNISELPYIKKILKMKNGNIKYVEYEEKGKGKEKLANFVDVPGLKWIFVTTIYTDVIKEGFKGFYRNLIIISLINLLLIWILGRIVVGYLIKNLGKVKNKIYNIVSGTEKADLTKRLEVETKDEIGEIANLVNLLFEKLNRDLLKVKVSSELLMNSSEESTEIMEKDIKKNTQVIEKSVREIQSQVDNAASGIEELTATVEEMARNIDSIANSMTRQASAVEESASSIEEMVRNIENTAVLSTKTKDISINLNNVSLEGSKAVKDSIASVKEVSEYSQQILKLLGLISNIAKQTNLLAMNAAIEAAHAGEAGKGFAIVADEIRRLAEDTNKNARDIGEVVSSIVSKIDESVKLAEKAGVGLDMITAYSKQNVDIISQLNIALQEQSNGAKEILKATQELVKITEEVKVAMTEQKHATDDFSKALVELRDISIQIVDNISTHRESLTSLVNAIEKIKVSVELTRKQTEELKSIVGNFILKEEISTPTALRLVE
jgi:methyl-accepting chemotaxis protein